MAVTVTRDVLHQYYRFSLYNSPFAAHDAGCAIDLYPDGERAPSPVAGDVLETKAVTAPPQSYAEAEDHLLLVDTGEYVARLLHVEPSVEAGDTVAVGDDVGRLVRAGFFAPWVPNHVHLGFRDPDANHYRAAGSLPVDLGIDVRPLDWDGTGTVVAAGETWARLDRPRHPAPGEQFAGVGATSARGSTLGVLDGGLPHYDWSGILGAVAGDADGVYLAGQRVGTRDGRTVAWDPVAVTANGASLTGIALFCSRDDAGVKLVGEDVDLAVGERVTVGIEPRSQSP